MNKLSFDNSIIINTRPTQQASDLDRKIKLLNGSVINYPCLSIHYKTAIEIESSISILPDIDIAIFVSANAVKAIMHCQKIKARHFIAIGPGTHNELKKYTDQKVHLPKKYDSNHLLRLPILQQVNGSNIVIGCGTNTKPLINETLKQRGGAIYKVISYHCSENTLPPLPSYDIPANKNVVIITTSTASLGRLVSMTPQTHIAWLLQQQLLVIHPAMVAKAINLGWKKQPWLSTDATTPGIIKELLQHMA